MSDFDIPEELIIPLQSYNKAAIEYGLFTPHEFYAAVQFFEDDFGHLFWAMENLKGENLIRSLREAKIHYDHRFYCEHHPFEQQAASYFHSRLSIFIEEIIKQPRTKLKERKIDFVELFNLPSEKDYVLDELIKNKIISKIDSTWLSQNKKTSKAVCVTFFRVLVDKHFIKKQMQDDNIFVNIAANFFHFTIDKKTFLRNQEKVDLVAKDYWNEFHFLKISDSNDVSKDTSDT